MSLIAKPEYQNNRRTGRGHKYFVRRAVRRALLALGEATTSQILRWAYPRGVRSSECATRAVRHAATRIAVRVRRLPAAHGGWVWRLKLPGE
jgi:hypothetical protein